MAASFKRIYCVRDITHDRFAQVFTQAREEAILEYAELGGYEALDLCPAGSRFLCAVCGAEVFMLDTSEDILLAQYVDLDTNEQCLGRLLTGLGRTPCETQEKLIQVQALAGELIHGLRGAPLFAHALERVDLDTLQRRVDQMQPGTDS